MKQPIIKILTRYTLYAARFFLIIAAIILCTKSPTIAADPPHSSANSVYCNSCHSVHKAAGTSLTSDASNANLCQSCHNGTVAKPLNDSMLAIPGTSGTSHRWDAAMPAGDSPDNQYGLIPTANLTSAALKGRLTTYGKVTCSVCHNQHGQADTPWDPNALAYNGQGTGSGRHFQRISDDLNQMCEDCHYYRTAATTGTNVTIYDGNKKSHPVVKIFSNDQGETPSPGLDTTQFNTSPREPASASWVPQTGTRYHLNGACSLLQYSDEASCIANGGTWTPDTNTTNNIVVDSSKKTRCLSCHGIHYTDSSSGTIDDEPGAATGDGYLLKRSSEETCHACHKTDQNRTGSSPDWADAIKTHNANRFGTCTVPAFNGTSQTECEAADGTWTPSTKWGANWGLSGGKYGEIVCTTCHTAHDTKHIYLIKETIKTPDDSNFQGRASNSVSVDFQTTATGNSGDPGLMGDETHADATSSRICEVCHTYDAAQTSGVKVHAYDMSAGAVNHQGIGGCTSCHSHKTSFSRPP